VNTSEFSTLDAAGVAAIRDSKTARLDMTSGRLSKDDVRVTQDSYGPEINTKDSGKISLTIAAPSGEISGEDGPYPFQHHGSAQRFQRGHLLPHGGYTRGVLPAHPRGRRPVRHFSRLSRRVDQQHAS
jgi:hypothetical protein